MYVSIGELPGKNGGKLTPDTFVDTAAMMEHEYAPKVEFRHNHTESDLRRLRNFVAMPNN